LAFLERLSPSSLRLTAYGVNVLLEASVAISRTTGCRNIAGALTCVLRTATQYVLCDGWYSDFNYAVITRSHWSSTVQGESVTSEGRNIQRQLRGSNGNVRLGRVRWNKRMNTLQWHSFL